MKRRRLLVVFLLCLTYPIQMVTSYFEDHEYSEEEEEEHYVPNSNCRTEVVQIPTGQKEEYYDPHYGHRRRYRDQYIIYKKCVCSNIVLSTGEPLNVIDSEPNGFTSITFKNSNIPLIPVGVFTAFTNLSELNLNGNLVNSIHPGAFTGLTKLKKMYLQDNNITKMSKGILNSLPDLNILNLSNNNMEVIEENAFLGLFSLEEIYLNNNKLVELLPDTFHKLNNLNIIDLSYNLLSEIPLSLFLDLSFHSDSNFVNLSNNNFTTINFLVFPGSLMNLTLQNNHINSIENWLYLQNIINLDLSSNALRNIGTLHKTLLNFNLSGNIIQELNNSFFNQSNNLQTLDVSRNLLRNVNEDTFVGLGHLTELYLQNNQISNVPIGCFRDLQSLRLLYLSNNDITEFEYGTFSGLSALTSFDISGNKLAYLYESCFHDLKNLQVLNVKDNLITSFDPHDLIDHSNKLQNVTLNNNPWVCKSLLNIVKTLEKNNVTVVKGSAQKTSHVHGIACLNYNVADMSVTFSPYFDNKVENASLARFYAISSEINAFKKFFNGDFLNSSFYKYFEHFREFNATRNFNESMSSFLNYFDDGFKNTTLYKYFERDFSNSNFFGRFDAAFQKLSKALSSLDVDFKNSSLYKFVNSNNANQNFSKYFDDGFKNSGFYKYFTKEFTNSEFFKYFDKTLQTRIESNLLKIRNYFDNDFKNSTFFTFFDEDRINRFNSNFIDHSDLNANFARLTETTHQINKEDIVSQISELSLTIKTQDDAVQSARTGSAIFMTIIVILLLAITFLLAFNRIRTSFKKNISKSVSENTIEGQEMHIVDGEMELM